MARRLTKEVIVYLLVISFVTGTSILVSFYDEPTKRVEQQIIVKNKKEIVSVPPQTVEQRHVQAQSIEPWFREQTKALKKKYIIERLQKDCEKNLKKYQKLVELNPQSKYYKWRLKTWRNRCEREHFHRRNNK